MLPAVTSKQMSEYERMAENRYGISTLILMENAGRSVAEHVDQELKGKKKRVLILCGQGNNGGDGFVVARFLKNRGHRVEVVFSGIEKKLKADSKINFNILKKMKIKITKLTSSNYLSISSQVKKWDGIVDALLGTGFKGALRPLYDAFIQEINKHSARTYAVDIPSGLDSNTGLVNTQSIRATTTIALGFFKKGMCTARAKKWCGKMILGDIGLPLPLYNRFPQFKGFGTYDR